MNALATGEIKRIVNYAQLTIVKDIYTDEPDVEICRDCGQLKDECLCNDETKLRLKLAEIIKEMGSDYLSKEVLTCDSDKLRSYLDIAVFFKPSEELYKLGKHAHVLSMQWTCDECGQYCTPDRFTNDKPLCARCHTELFGH